MVKKKKSDKDIKSVTIRFDSKSEDYRWIRSQSNMNNTLHLLIKMARTQYGDGDLIEKAMNQMATGSLGFGGQQPATPMAQPTSNVTPPAQTQTPVAQSSGSQKQSSAPIPVDDDDEAPMPDFGNSNIFKTPNGTDLGAKSNQQSSSSDEWRDGL